MHLRPGVTTYAIAWMLQTRSMAPSLIYTVSFSLRKIIHLVHLHSGTVWRTHNPLCRLSQGDTSMSWDLPFNFVSDPYFYSPLLPEPFELVLNKLHPNVLSVWLCRIHDSDTQIQDQGHTSRSCSNTLEFRVCSTYLLNHLNDLHLTSFKF